MNTYAINVGVFDGFSNHQISVNTKMDDFIAEQQLFVKTTVKTNKFVYFTWVILGISLVIPWNCFINSTGFILLRLSDNETQWADKEISSNSYQDFWLSAVGITMNIFGAIVLFYDKIGEHSVFNKRFHFLIT